MDRVVKPPSLTKTKSQKARARASNRVQTRIMGSGSYDMKSFINPMRQALKPILKEALINGGGALGSLVNVPGGRSMGASLGKRISKLLGSGDYTTNEVSVNSLINSNKSTLPSASFGEDGTEVRVRRREFLADVLTSDVAGAFKNYAYSINPGLSTSFPFLSQLAANYEEYCFDGLVFEFVTSASPYISTSALGTVVASMEYNASSPVFTSKFTMENSAAAVSTRLDKSLMYGIECARGQNAQNCYYVRTGTSDVPLNSTDMGNFQLAIAPGAGVPVSSVVGELWVTYDVVLKRPVLNPSRVGSMTYTATGASTAAVAGTSNKVTTTSGRLTGATFTSGTLTGIWTLPGLVGDVVQVTVYHSGTATTTWAIPTLTYTGCEAKLGLMGDTTVSTNSIPGAVASTTRTVTNVLVKMTASLATITATYTSGVLPTAASVYVSAVVLGNSDVETAF